MLDQAGFEYAKPDGTFYIFVKTPMKDDKEFVTPQRKVSDTLLFRRGLRLSRICPFRYCVSYDMIVRATPNIIALGKEPGMQSLKQPDFN